jgi:hypothetical protein
MKLLIDIMKRTTHKFFNPTANLSTFYIMARIHFASPIEFFYTDIIENEFILDTPFNEPLETELQKYINLFSYSKKILNVLNRFVYNYKIKKIFVKYEMNMDLYFNDLNNYPNKQKISIVENNTIYFFRLSDLLNLWNDCLQKTEGLFPKPIELKNPYTNLTIGKYNLYNIYFKAFNSHFQIPLLIYKFFRREFNINAFTQEYFPYLKDNCIYQFIQDGHIYEKYEQFENMFFDYRKDISYCNLPLRYDLTRSEMDQYNRILSPVLKNYLLGTISCNNMLKDKYFKSGKEHLAKIVNKYKHLFIVPRLDTVRSLRRARVHSTLNDTPIIRYQPPVSAPPPPPPVSAPPPPPPVYIPPPQNRLSNIITRNMNTPNSSLINTFRSNPSTTNTSTYNSRTSRAILPTINRRPELNRLIEQLDLQYLNAASSDPFIPSTQLARSPMRNNI